MEYCRCTENSRCNTRKSTYDSTVAAAAAEKNWLLPVIKKNEEKFPLIFRHFLSLASLIISLSSSFYIDGAHIRWICLSTHSHSLTPQIRYFFPSFAEFSIIIQILTINSKMFLPTLFLISCHLTSGSSYTFLSIGDWGANTIPDRGSMSYQKNVGAVASQLTKSYQENDAKFVLNLVRTSSSEIRHTFFF